MQKTSQIKSAKWISSKLLRTVCVAFFCILPILLASIPFLYEDASIKAYTSIYSDEIDYWAEAAAIGKYGVINNNTGFFGYNANNTAKLLNYGPHSFFSLLPYALVGKAFNMHPVMMLITNVLLVSFATLGFFLVTRSLRKTALSVLLLYVFSPFICYFFMGMIELLIFACMLFLSAVYYKSTIEDEKPLYRKLYIALVIISSLFRQTSIFLLLPVYIKECFDEPRKWWWSCIKFVLISIVIAVFVFSHTAAYPWGFLAQLFESNNKIIFFLRHGFSTGLNFFLPAYNSPLELVLNYAYFIWLGFLSISFIKRMKILDKKGKTFYLGQIAILVSNIIFLFLLYDFSVFKGFRLLSPVLFFSVISTMLTKTLPKPRLSYAVVGASLWLALLIAFIPISSELYRDRIQQRFYPKHKPQIFRNIRFDPFTEDRWENTVYVDIFVLTHLDYHFFEPGLGMMYFRADELNDILVKSGAESLKANYLISSSDWTPLGYEHLLEEDDIHLFIKTDP